MIAYLLCGAILCTAVIATVAHAQLRDIDSLKSLLRVPDKLTLADSVSVNMLNRLAMLYRLRSSDSALYYAEQAAHIAEQIGYPKGKLYALLTRLSVYGGYNTSTSNLSLIKSTADSAVQLARAMSDQIKADAMLEVGRAYSSRLDKEEGIRMLLEALKSYERLGDKTGMSKAWYYIALVHYTNESYQDALTANQQAARLMQETGNRRSTSIILNNLALCYDALGQADTAISIWKQALSLAEAVDEVQTIWSVTANLARVCLRQQQYSEAERYIARSLEVSKPYPARYASSLMHKGRIHLAKKELQEALRCAEESLRLYQKSQGYAIDECLKLLAEIYAEMGRFKDAYTFQKRYSEFQDSAYTARKAAIVAELQSKYDVEKKNQEIELLRRDRERDAIVRTALLGGVVLTTSLALVIANRFRLKQKAEAEIQEKNLALSAALQEAEHQAAEAHRQRLEAEAQRKVAEDANALKTELLSIASHDLRNPLQSIIGFTLLIKEKYADDKALVTSLEKIERAAERMLRLIHDLLATAALDAGKLTLKQEIVSVDELLHSVVESLQVQAEKKNQVLYLRAESGAKVNVDPDRMREVFENLISNAIKYSGFGKPIWITVENALGCVQTSQNAASGQSGENELVRIAVRDEGEGLSEDDMKRMFGRFQRLSARPTGGESSTGLGLFIVKQIVELHSGRIWAESEGKGKGATFIVELPAVKA
ncbi:MAG: tetratricopeptide repeat-containing sensor histidine kinase [Chloroherpetonaceae bacterium]|nr:tetratricopeptide repeat-containing sensor histidine kinase [Chloroherpetonaceae bacterium]